MSSFISFSDSLQRNGPIALASAATLAHSDDAPSANLDSLPSTGQHDEGRKKGETTERMNVNHSCLYGRRSHMTCDERRPCQCCTKCEIRHLCHDEWRSAKLTDKQPTDAATVGMLRTFVPGIQPPSTQRPHQSEWPMNVIQVQPFYPEPETFGNEFSALNHLLEAPNEGIFFAPSSSSSIFAPTLNVDSMRLNLISDPLCMNVIDGAAQDHRETQRNNDMSSAILPSLTKAERFILAAADQESGSRNERLNRIIRSKYEAGLLKPYNYVKGYARLSRWMDGNVSQASKQRILQPLSVLRPKFRAVAQSLRDLQDLSSIEETFERLLLDYDRVFAAMGVPACLWRRTGEIYKCNQEFIELLGIDGYMMRDGRLCIYELMAEESAVNYWEKYGLVAFDSSQKSVLTSCALRYKPLLKSNSDSPDSFQVALEEDPTDEEDFISCCFSFTIRRDKWGIPTMIVGNFIKC
ncbi:hypothetical protein L208DRAFT_1305608 [Tricholoma matsutake]|nr:hypothetical protein L208DRAFT_1305608 [Tricholoma matsutake 945]